MLISTVLQNYIADKFLWFTLGDKVDALEDYNLKSDGDKKDYDIVNDRSGKGTSPSDRKYRIQLYLNEHNISANLESGHKISKDSYNELSERGQVIISIFEGETIYTQDASGKLIEKTTMGKDEGHAMPVTGIDNNGNLFLGRKIFYKNR